MAHQQEVHKDSHRIIGNFGGYGTGKTTTSREEVYKHIFLTPNANVLIGAAITPQYEQTIKRELEADIPKAFVKDYSTQKSTMDFINGARIMYRPLDDEGKLRSLNLSMYVMVEASEVDKSIFHQLKTRHRNLSATKQLEINGQPQFKYTAGGQPIPIIGADWRKAIVESNPDAGWISSDVLLVSEKINKHGSVTDDYTQDPKEIDKNIASHVATTDVNEYLPETFIDELKKNKPRWWVERYLYSSFSYAEGLVYPNAKKCIVPTFEVPKSWKRMVAFDYGLSDLAAFIFGAVDEDTGTLYIYKEIIMHNANIQELAEAYKKGVEDIPQGQMWGQPLIDPKNAAKRDYNKKDLYYYFSEYDIFFRPGVVSVDARVMRTKTYTDLERVKIMDCCENLCKEIVAYKYPERTLKNTTDKVKPQDKNNHSINAMEWIIMELPANPKDLVYGIYGPSGTNISKPVKELTPWGTEEYSYPDDTPYAFGIDFKHIY